MTVDDHLDPGARLEHAKDELLREAGKDPSGSVSEQTGLPSLDAFLHRYYRHVAPEDFVGRQAEDILTAALSHRELAEARPQGTANVRVTSPDGEGAAIVEVSPTTCPSSSTR